MRQFNEELREAHFRIDETSTFQATEDKNEVYYKVEVEDLNQTQFWLTTPVRMTKSEIAKKLGRRFENFYFVNETMAIAKKYPVLPLDAVMKYKDAEILKCTKPKRKYA